MNNSSQKICVFMVVMLLSFAGCGKRKKAQEPCKDTCAQEQKQEAQKEIGINMPLENAQNTNNEFDDDLAEFALVDDADKAPTEVAKIETCEQPAAPVQEAAVTAQNPDANEFSWIEEEDSRDKSVKTVYFDFDKYSIRKDQETSVENNVTLLKKRLEDDAKSGKKTVVVVEGHACSSAGTAAYNLALSEKRAKVLADKLVQAGIPRDNIKIVGRGQECPSLDKDGNAVAGSREQQWPNRRDEVNMICA